MLANVGRTAKSAGAYATIGAAIAVFMKRRSKAIVLELVDPLWAERYLVGFNGLARFGEPGRLAPGPWQRGERINMG